MVAIKKQVEDFETLFNKPLYLFQKEYYNYVLNLSDNVDEKFLQQAVNFEDFKDLPAKASIIIIGLFEKVIEKKSKAGKLYKLLTLIDMGNNKYNVYMKLQTFEDVENNKCKFIKNNLYIMKCVKASNNLVFFDNVIIKI